MGEKLHTISTPITAIAFNKSCNALALCPNTPEVKIYEREGDDWVLKHTLLEHSEVVTGIDWAPDSNAIVTCGQDRNAYEWEFVDGKWNPTLVILRVSHAATCVKWAPNERKFACGSASKCIAVCYFEPQNNWWVSKQIKKQISSTVLCIDWHPDNALVAAGCSDFRARIFCAAVKATGKDGKSIDKKPKPTPWGENDKFGECVAEFDYGCGWVHGISFAPSGNKLAFVAHDSSLFVVEAGSSGHVTRAHTRDLPYRAVRFLTENTLVAAGHDCNVSAYSGRDGADWAFLTNLDQAAAGGGEAKAVSSTRAAFSTFQKSDKLGATDKESTETALATLHQNAVVDIAPIVWNADHTAVTDFVTIGLDGQVIVWNVAAVAAAVREFRVV